jgi:hypothetical protein
MDRDENQSEQLGVRFYGGIALILAGLPLVYYGLSVVPSDLQSVWPIPAVGALLWAIGIVFVISHFVKRSADRL